MADAALSKSLDDLIKEQRQKKPKVRCRRAPPDPWTSPAHPDLPLQSRQAPAKRKDGKAKKAANLQAAVRMTTDKGAGNAAKKNRRRKSGGGGGGAGAPTPMVVTVPVASGGTKKRRKSKSTAAAVVLGDAAARVRGPRAPSLLGTKLFISNLDYNVSNADIKELFETIGPLLSHRVHKDNAGRSAGTAEVVFADRGLAATAQKRYHSIELDGRPMNIELIEKLTQPGHTLKSGIKISGGPGRVVQVPRGMSQAMAQAVAQQKGQQQQKQQKRGPRGRGRSRGGGGGGGSARMMMD